MVFVYIPNSVVTIVHSNFSHAHLTVNPNSNTHTPIQNEFPVKNQVYLYFLRLVYLGKKNTVPLGIRSNSKITQVWKSTKSRYSEDRPNKLHNSPSVLTYQSFVNLTTTKQKQKLRLLLLNNHQSIRSGTIGKVLCCVEAS